MTEKKQNTVERKELKVLFFFFLICEVINTRGRIKVVQLNISENSLC